MEIIVTAHAVRRFQQRIENLPARKARFKIERMMAESVDLPKERQRLVGRFDGSLYWWHQETNVVFVIARLGDRLSVLTVIHNKPGNRHARRDKADPWHRKYRRDRRIQTEE